MLRKRLSCLILSSVLLGGCNAAPKPSVTETPTVSVSEEILLDDVVLDHTSHLMPGVTSFPVTLSRFPVTAEYCKIIVSDGSVSDAVLLLDSETTFSYTLPDSFSKIASVSLVFYNENDREIASARMILTPGTLLEPDSIGPDSCFISTISSKSPVEGTAEP